MDFSMGGITSMLDSARTGAADGAAERLEKSAKGLGASSTDDELMEVCKDFSSYFMELALQEVKENLTPEDEEADSSLNALTDFYMDKTIEVLADEMADQVGTGFTQQLYEQMKRNYGLE